MGDGEEEEAYNLTLSRFQVCFSILLGLCFYSDIPFFLSLAVFSLIDFVILLFVHSLLHLLFLVLISFKIICTAGMKDELILSRMLVEDGVDVYRVCISGSIFFYRIGNRL